MLLLHAGANVDDVQNRGPLYSTLNSRILTMKTPK